MLGLMEIAPNFNLLLLSLKPTKSSSSFNCFDLVHLLHEIDEIERTTYDAILLHFTSCAQDGKEQ